MLLNVIFKKKNSRTQKSMYLSKNFKHSRAKNTFKIAWSDAINFHLPCKKMALLSICIMTGKAVILPILKVIFQPMEIINCT